MTRWIFGNWQLKLLSAGVATLLWMATVGQSDTTTSMSVPVQYRNVPKDLEISSEVTESAFVEMRGSEGRLSGSNLANTVVLVDLGRERRPGERTFSILEGNVSLPPGVQFVRAVPSQIRVRLEPRVTREVPVQVRYASPRVDGYRIASQEVIPRTVKIVGPESRVNAIDRVQTDPIEFSAQDEGESLVHVHAFIGDPFVRLVESDLTIGVKVNLEKTR